jgi:hypothetical protein
VIQTAQEIIDHVTGGLHGTIVTGIERGVGSMLAIDLGPRPEGAPRAEWHLWVCLVDWRLRNDGGLLAGSADRPEAIDEAIQGLAGSTLRTIEFDATGDVTVAFDGLVLDLISTAAPGGDDDEWALFTPAGTVLSMGAGGQWRYGPSGTLR